MIRKATCDCSARWHRHVELQRKLNQIQPFLLTRLHRFGGAPYGADPCGITLYPLEGTRSAAAFLSQTEASERRIIHAQDSTEVRSMRQAVQAKQLTASYVTHASACLTHTGKRSHHHTEIHTDSLLGRRRADEHTRVYTQSALSLGCV